MFFVLFAVVLIGTLKQRPVYRAQALIEIQRENPDIPSIKELFELETVSDAYLETQYRVLRSESLTRRVINQLRLDKLDEFNPRQGWWTLPRRVGTKASASQALAVGSSPSEQDPDAYQMTLKRFQDRLSIEPVRRSRLVGLSFESRDPDLAARVVNTLSANYIEQSLEARWEATEKASEWLSQQLSGLKGKLEKSEDELQRYMHENGLLFLETEKGNAENIVNERLRQLQEELTKAQAARYEKESLYRLVQAGDYGSLPGVFENKLMQDLTVRLAELKRESAQLASTFNPDYPKVKEIQSQVNEIEAVLERERKRAAKRITNDYLAAGRRENLVRQAFEEQQKQASLIAERSVQYNILKREVETNKQLYEGLLQRLKEAGVSAGLKSTNIHIVDSAVTPRKPAKPKVLLNLALAVILGLGLGVGAAFLQERLDNTLKSTDDVERFLGLPALAFIPSVESLNDRRGGVYGLFERRKTLTIGEDKPTTKLATRWHRIDLEDQQHSALSEAFRSLRTSVLLSTADHPPGSLLVTSAQPAEGKTTIATNLAISLAQLGRRVLLIDADMRRPNVHKLFRIQNGLGLVTSLTGQQQWQGVVHPTGLGGLDALFCGTVPPNPVELLSSERMRMLIREAMVQYNFVVIDSAPLLGVADSRVLATLVEGVLLVAKGGSTARELVQRAQLSARDVGANVIGIVLNNMDVRAHDYYHSQYYLYADKENEDGQQT
jgi:capsular exopolysaccharide synthesis family protein